MKKFTQNPAQPLLLQLLGTAAAVMLLALPARGEVYKCTGTDGKTAFSDQPCEASQKSSTINPKAASGASVGTAGANKALSTMDYKSRPEYSECLWLKTRLNDYFMGPVVGTTAKQAEQARDDLARYKVICAVVDQAAGRELKEKLDVQKTPRRETNRAVEEAPRCEAMINNLAELRKLGPALAKSTDRLNPQEALLRKKEIAEIEQRIPLIAEEIEKKCSKR
jgi:hypothetical protein